MNTDAWLPLSPAWVPGDCPQGGPCPRVLTLHGAVNYCDGVTPSGITFTSGSTKKSRWQWGASAPGLLGLKSQFCHFPEGRPERIPPSSCLGLPVCTRGERQPPPPWHACPGGCRQLEAQPRRDTAGMSQPFPEGAGDLRGCAWASQGMGAASGRFDHEDECSSA